MKKRFTPAVLAALLYLSTASLAVAAGAEGKLPPVTHQELETDGLLGPYADTGKIAGQFNKTNKVVNKNSDAIAQNRSHIDQNKSDITQNTSDITQNTSAINKNKTGIAQNKTDITDIRSSIGDDDFRKTSVQQYIADMNQRFDTDIQQAVHSADDYTDQIAKQTLEDAKDYTDYLYNQLNGKMKKLRARADAGIAGATAIASLPFAGASKDSIVGGLGIAKNEVAGAVGYQHSLNTHWTGRVTLSIADKYVQGGAGFGYSW